MLKEEKGTTQVFSYEVVMLVHVVSETEEKARKQLDEQGGIVTSREVELKNKVALYGEKESK